MGSCGWFMKIRRTSLNASVMSVICDGR